MIDENKLIELGNESTNEKECIMNELITMKPIPYRHMKSVFIDWVESNFPQLKGKIVNIDFDINGLIVTYKN